MLIKHYIKNFIKELVNLKGRGVEQSKGQCHAPEFSFAFNDSNFSNRMLQIQALPDGWNDGVLDAISFLNSNMILTNFHSLCNHHLFRPLPCRS